MASTEARQHNDPGSKKAAYQFIVLMGIVSLFGDMTYEGARSITGPFLNTLGASAAMVGFVTGFGELLGYALRLLSGYLADRTKAYWILTILGYALILAIPLLGLTGIWQVAAVFIILERVGKAVRAPSRDTILSHATSQVGRGWGFGIHEALDQIGAVTGPLIFSAVFLLHGSYSQGFTILWIPAVLTLVFLFTARGRLPSPEKLECSHPSITLPSGKLPKIFWYYTVFVSLSVSGFASFQLISYHFKAHAVMQDAYIPVLYALAMGVDAGMALLVGKLYDKIGFTSLAIIPFLTAAVPFFGFSLNPTFAVIAIVLWGAIMGTHETIMRAAIADITHIEKRGSGYGIFNTVYGLSFFLGSILMGLFYERSVTYIYVFAGITQALSLVVFFALKRAAKP